MRVMTPEERFDRIERQLEFLANHQAQLSADIAAHSDQIAKLSDVVVSLAHIVEQHEQRMEEEYRRTEEQFRRTDERLNILVNTVDRHISNHRH